MSSVSTHVTQPLSHPSSTESTALSAAQCTEPLLELLHRWIEESEGDEQRRLAATTIEHGWRARSTTLNLHGFGLTDFITRSRKGSPHDMTAWMTLMSTQWMRHYLIPVILQKKIRYLSYLG